MSTLRVYNVTFNCGRSKADPAGFAKHLFSALPSQSNPPEVLVICLQEIAPIAYSFLGGSHLFPYLQKFKDAVDVATAALDDGVSYANIVNRNVGMTAIMLFVLREQTTRVKNLQTAEVGVGFLEMGNKGAVALRIGYSSRGTSTSCLTFVSAHLAPMEWNCKRRNEDWSNIVRGLVFEPISYNPLSRNKNHRLHQPSSEADTDPLFADQRKPSAYRGIYTSTTYLFVAGDLNYRTAHTAPDQIQQNRFPQPCEDESYPRHFWHLLSSDQLEAEIKAGRTCHGLQEAPIDFPPTYKYSDKVRHKLRRREIRAEKMDEAEIGNWDWARHRWPSWCDRVLYLGTPPYMKGGQVSVKGYKALPLMATSDHRPVACAFEIPEEAIPDPSEGEEDEGGVRCHPPYAIYPHWKGRRQIVRYAELVVGLGILSATTWSGLLLCVITIFLVAVYYMI